MGQSENDTAGRRVAQYKDRDNILSDSGTYFKFYSECIYANEQDNCERNEMRIVFRAGESAGCTIDYTHDTSRSMHNRHGKRGHKHDREWDTDYNKKRDWARNL
ncbi:hypothetical protein EVAR_87821_1 [Eumeta japonica]|uniref:Uncharacterized protein n=1 Tax=Eumeta variegata TaxID=151549 RepID=A0A4C1Z680_EUMVA|nr:hypothetical protein EVAR_87821_1 [Eumeta japonica]